MRVVIRLSAFTNRSSLSLTNVIGDLWGFLYLALRSALFQKPLHSRKQILLYAVPLRILQLEVSYWLFTLEI
jgi:hypothetical protein